MRAPFWILLAAMAAFGVSLASGFHLDDYAIFSDPALTSADGWWRVWQPLQTRPLTYFTFWLNYQAGGRNPFGYHAVNLALHLVAVWLLCDVLSRLMPRFAALAAAAIFAVHPIQTEAVVYVWARSTLLATVLCLASWRVWLAGRRWQAVIWFAAALLAKEECAAFPLVLWLTGKPGKTWTVAPVLTMLGLSLAAAMRVIWALSLTPHAPAGAQAGISPWAYLLAQGPAIWRYLRMVLVPWGFTIDPDIAVPPMWLGISAWLALVAVAGATWRWAWFAAGLALLLPSSSIFPAADLAADRRMYLPMAALSAGIGLIVAQYRKLRILGIVLLALSVERTLVWRSEQALWTEAMERAPRKLRPRIHLARAVPRLEEAIAILRQAEKLAPEDPAVASEIGRMLLSVGRAQEALNEFGRALALSPRDAEAINNRGAALRALGQTEAARRDFERALALDECQFDARYNLMNLGIATAARPGCRYTDEQRRLLAGR